MYIYPNSYSRLYFIMTGHEHTKDVIVSETLGALMLGEGPKRSQAPRAAAAEVFSYPL